MKLLLDIKNKILRDISQKEQAKTSFKLFLKNTQEELKKIGQFFQISIHFHPSHLRPKIINTSFCVLVGLLLTKCYHYFKVFMDINVFLAIQIDTKICDTAPLKPFLKSGENSREM